MENTIKVLYNKNGTSDITYTLCDAEYRSFLFFKKRERFIRCKRNSLKNSKHITIGEFYRNSFINKHKFELLRNESWEDAIIKIEEMMGL